jgi:hypothetical protein
MAVYFYKKPDFDQIYNLIRHIEDLYEDQMLRVKRSEAMDYSMNV